MKNVTQRLLRALSPGYEGSYVLYQIVDHGYYHSGFSTNPGSVGWAINSVPGFVNTGSRETAEAHVEALIANRVEDDPVYGPMYEEVK